MAVFKTGPNRSQAQEESKELQRAHLDNIKRLAMRVSWFLQGLFLISVICAVFTSLL
jgi:hypothetical protein